MLKVQCVAALRRLEDYHGRWQWGIVQGSIGAVNKSMALFFGSNCVANQHTFPRNVACK